MNCRPLRNPDKSIAVPNLFIPGAPKSGTSSLHNYLDQHPLIQMSGVKEPHNYSIDENYGRRYDKSYHRSYCNIFEIRESISYYGESSSTHLACPVTAGRIAADNPDARIIIILRDPVDRIISHYNWLKSLDLTNGSIFDEIRSTLSDPFNPSDVHDGNFKSYLDFSKYGNQIQRYIDFFTIQSIHIVTFEALVSQPEETMNGCFEFLQIDQVPVDHSVIHNETQRHYNSNRPDFEKELLHPGQVTYLKELLDADVKFVENLMGRELPEWKNFR